MGVDLFRREGDSQRWVLHPLEAGQALEWASVGLVMPIEALYEDVALVSPAAARQHP